QAGLPVLPQGRGARDHAADPDPGAGRRGAPLWPLRRAASRRSRARSSLTSAGPSTMAPRRRPNEGPAMQALLPTLTSILPLAMALALFDQWRERRQAFQLVWAIGMAFFGIASGCEAIAAAAGWNEILYRTWYLAGAVLTAGWLGLGTAVLLARTRFGYTYGI